MVAAGPEQVLLGGSSPLPLRVWRVDLADVGQYPKSVLVALPDARYVAGPADGAMAPGIRARFALKCSGDRWRGLRLCTTASAGDGVVPAP